ncbi:hypothetical protein [Scytonema sp. NUACC26]|uniref:hypothetical protein n=1 Tax=Scytonema sp. NUACC26 TaxID=3140176 RepID=UPI0034DB9B1F
MQIIKNFINVVKPLSRENNLFLTNKLLLQKSHTLLSQNITNPLVTMKGMRLTSFVPLVKYADLFPLISRSKLFNEWDTNEWDSKITFINPEFLEASRQEAKIQDNHPLEAKTITFTNSLLDKVESQELNQQTEINPQKSTKKSRTSKSKAKSSSKSTKNISPVNERINYSTDEVSTINRVNTNDLIKVSEDSPTVADSQVLNRLNISDVQHSLPTLLEDIEFSNINVIDTETIPTAKQSIQASESIEKRPITNKSTQNSESIEIKPIAKKFIQDNEGTEIRPTAKKSIQNSESKKSNTKTKKQGKQKKQLSNIVPSPQTNSKILENDSTLLQTSIPTEELTTVKDSENIYFVSDSNSADANIQDPINSQAISLERIFRESDEDSQIQRQTLTNIADVLPNEFLVDEALVEDRSPNFTSEIGSTTIASDPIQITPAQKASSTIINEIAETEEETATHSLLEEPPPQDLVVNPYHSIRFSPNTQNQTTSDLTSQLEEENTSKSEISTKNNISDRGKTQPSKILDNSTQNHGIIENSSLVAQDDKFTISRKKEDIETKIVTRALPTEISSEVINSSSNTPLEQNDVFSEFADTLAQHKDETTSISNTANTEIENTTHIVPTEPQNGSLVTNSIAPLLDVCSERTTSQPIQTIPSLVESPASNLENNSVAENQVGSATDFLSTQEKPNMSVENNTLLIELFDDRTGEKLPILQGFAVGGEVEVSANLANQQIAPSDVVPAMLTPGEFVVNATDAQKNLNLLRHINSGGKAENLTRISAEPLTVQRKKENSTKVDIADSRAEEQNFDTSLATVFKSLNVSTNLSNSNQKNISVLLRSIQSDKLNNTTSVKSTSSTNYSSTPLIFRQKKSTPPQPSMNSNYDAIAQWSSVEDLLNFTHRDENQDNFTSFNLTDLQFQSNDSQTPNVSKPTKNLVHQKAPIQYFADGGEVTAPTQITDANTPLLAETIEQFTSNSNDVNVPDIENLAREIYTRLRQRLEIERERHGIYSGRLPW